MACGHHPCSCDRDERGILDFFECLGFPLTPWIPPADIDIRLAAHRWRAACASFYPSQGAEPTATTPLALWTSWHAYDVFCNHAFREHRLQLLYQRYVTDDEPYRASVRHALAEGSHLPGLHALYGNLLEPCCPVERLLRMRPWTLAGIGEHVSYLYIRSGLGRLVAAWDRHALEAFLPLTPAQPAVACRRL